MDVPTTGARSTSPPTHGNEMRIVESGAGVQTRPRQTRGRHFRPEVVHSEVGNDAALISVIVVAVGDSTSDPATWAAGVTPRVTVNVPVLPPAIGAMPVTVRISLSILMLNPAMAGN